MAGTVTFMGLKLSQPELAKAVIEPLLQALVSNLTGVKTDFGTTAALPGLAGETKNAQQSRKDMALGALRQILSGVLLGQQATTAGSAQLQLTKAQLQATEASARAAGFDVLPNGVVRVSGKQRAYCRAHWESGGEALLRMLEAWAAQYTMQVQGTLTQASTIDAQIATALVKVATDYLTNLFQKKSDTPAVPPPTTAPGLPPPPATVPTPPATNLPTTPGATPLPAGGVATAGTGTVLAGAGALGGAIPLGGAAGVQLTGAGVGGAAGAAVALAGTAGGGVVGVGPGAASAAGARGLAGTGGMPMMGAGGHGAGGRESGDRMTEDWLVEDGDSWRPGDAPDGVIT